jgi:quercetin dioxygenase-like cupin family protein
MSNSDDDRRREHPGERFQDSVIQQNLKELSDQLNEEDLGEHHNTRGHNQIELYRKNGTTVSLFQFEQGAHIPEHKVEDGSVMIQVLEGKLCFQTEDAETHLHPQDEDVVVLEPDTPHSVQAEKPTRMLLTIMREE